MKYLLLAIFLSIGVLNADMVTASKDSKVVVAPITQPHPRLWISRDRLDFLRQAYNAKTEPHYTALLKMVAVANANLSVAPNPYSGNHPDQWRISGTNDGKAAVCLAISYHITEESKYKHKAIEIIMARPVNFPKPWANVDENIGLNFPNRGLFTICGTSGLILAYDLLVSEPEFSSEDKKTVELWLNELLTIIKEDIIRWDTPYKSVTTQTDPRGWIETTDPRDKYFGGQHFQNHVGENLMGILQIGYVLGDRELVQYALDSDENPRDLKEMIDGAIHIEGDTDFVRFELPRVLEIGKIKGKDLSLADWHILPPQTGEIYDRYRTIEGSGFGYSQLGLRLLMLSAELAYKNGIDFYQYTGSDGESLLLPFKFYSDFLVTGDSTIKGGYYVWSQINDNAANEFAEMYELGVLRYPEHKDEFLGVLQMKKYRRADVSLYPTHRPNLSWLIAFGEADFNPKK